MRRMLLVCLLVAYLLPAPSRAGDPPAPPASPRTSAKDPFSEDLESLLDMKVTTASKYSERVSEAPAVMSVVTQDELQRFGGMTLREILERVPGLAGSTASFTDRSVVAARGDQTAPDGGHILILINGRPTREVLDGGIISDLLESFPVNILERIEVMMGPGSVLYGSNAYSAVINLISLKAKGKELVVTGQGGPAGAAATSGRVLFHQGDLSITAAGQFHQRPDWVTPVWTMASGLQTATVPDRGKGAYLGVEYKGLSLMSSFTEWNNSYVNIDVGSARWRRGFADLGYRWSLNDRWEIGIDFTYTRSTIAAGQGSTFMSGDSDESLLEWTNVIHVTGKDRLTVGALYSDSRATARATGITPPVAPIKGSRQASAFYAQLEHELPGSVKLIGGIQANKIGDIKLDVVPRGGVIWTPDLHWSVKALYSRAFRAPSLREVLPGQRPPDDPAANPGLRLEKVATIDIGPSYQGSRFQTGIDYFHSAQTDTISTSGGTYLNSSMIGADEPQGNGKITFQGVGVDGKWYLRDGFFATGSLSYQATLGGNRNKFVTPIAKTGTKAGISYESQNGFTAGLFAVYQGHLDGYAGARNPPPGAYSLLNGNLRLELSKFLHADAFRGLALVAHAENLQNRQVWLPNWNVMPGDSIFANRGRTVYIGVEMSWKQD